MPKVLTVTSDQWAILKPLLLSLLKEEPSFKFLRESDFDYIVRMFKDLDQWGEDEMEIFYICNNAIRSGYYRVY